MGTENCELTATANALGFACDCCGACCSRLIVEADVVDVMREPRILDADQGRKEGEPGLSWRDMLVDGKVPILACGEPCRFLQADKRCAIYPTRPTTCVSFAAGKPQCQDARRWAGLPPLDPVALAVVTPDVFEDED